MSERGRASGTYLGQFPVWGFGDGSEFEAVFARLRVRNRLVRTIFRSVFCMASTVLFAVCLNSGSVVVK